MVQTARKVAKPQTAHTVPQLSKDAPTFRDEIERFVSSKQAKGVKPGTLYSYHKEMTKFADWAESVDAPTDALSLSGSAGRPYVEGYMAYLFDLGRANGTVRDWYGVARTFWLWMIDVSEEGEVEPFVKRSPLRGVDAPKNIRGDTVGEPYSPEEIARIVKAAGDKGTRNIWRRRDRSLVLVLAGSGIRRQEAARLKVSDYASGKIVVRRSVGKASTSDPYRTTAIYNSSRVEVDNYVALLKYKGLGGDDMPLFPSERRAKDGRTHMQSGGISTLIKRTVHNARHACPKAAKTPDDNLRYCQECEDGVPVCKGCDKCVRYGGVHRFRATAAIDARRNGVSETSVMKRFGWKSADMLRRYTEKRLTEIADDEFDAAYAH